MPWSVFWTFLLQATITIFSLIVWVVVLFATVSALREWAGKAEQDPEERSCEEGLQDLENP